MAGPDSASRQVPLRLTEDVVRILEVARLATGAKSMQAFLSGLVGDAAERYAGEPEIQAILQSVEEYQARGSGKLRRLGGAKEGSARGRRASSSSS